MTTYVNSGIIIMSSIKKGADSINNNFKSIKKEYAILCIYGSGTPFYLDKYDSYEKAKFHLLDMVSLEKERGRPYYVDNPSLVVVSKEEYCK